MSEMCLDFSAGLTGLDAPEWVSTLEDVAEEYGFFEFLGPMHLATYLKAGPQLLVTFENAETIRQGLPAAEPRGFAFTRREGWSHLALISEGESWFRDGYVYRFFDRLIDEGFFEDYDSVLFYGAHAAGYAAAAFSVAAPGARVLALRPQATLDPQVAGWDNRHMSQRRQNFTDRYGYAPEMIEAAERAYIVFSPAQRIDAMHAALFTKPNVTMLRVTGLSWKLDAMFDLIGVQDDLLRAAMTGDLTPARFARLMRASKGHNIYLRGLLRRAIDRGHEALAAHVCAYILRDRHDPYFATELEKLSDMGISPPRRMTASAAE